ncbi:MAG: hypothetical protein IH612_08455 [Desulfofustis sp.]|nr:hypothetical protein [Desulfofustis sp.]
MNSFQKVIIVRVGAPILASIIDHMLNDENLVKYRDAAVAFMQRAARKTENTVDDMAVNLAVDFIMTPENYIKYGHNMISWAIAYVQDSETDWDDFAFLPILRRLESVCVGLE